MAKQKLVIELNESQIDVIKTIVDEDGQYYNWNDPDDISMALLNLIEVVNDIL